MQNVENSRLLFLFSMICEKDLVSWRTMICICVENECPRNALDIFLQMRRFSFEPDETIIRYIILAVLRAEELIRFGPEFHAYLEKNGLLSFNWIGIELLQMYSKFGEFGFAQMVFNQMNHRDLIAWSAMIAVYARGGKPKDSLSVFRQMQSIKEKPNEIIFVSLLQACSALCAQELGESIHGFITKADLSATLIDFYCKIGSIKQGKAIFDDISSKDLICWSSMINGYGFNGCGREAIETFTNILNCGIKPNDTVFLSVLSACSQCGLEQEGHKWFYSMQEKFGLTPKLSHYACMVDLLSRQGSVKEALAFVKKMPVAPDKRIWGSLLAGCRSRRDGSIEVAEFVVQKLSAANPEATSHYLTLLDLYAEQSRWKDVESDEISR